MNLEKSIENELKERKTFNIVGILLESDIKDTIIIEQNTLDIPNLPRSFRYFISKQNLVGDVKKLDKESVAGNQLYCVPVEKNADIQIQQMYSVKAGVSSPFELPVKMENTSSSQKRSFRIREGCYVNFTWKCFKEPLFRINICYPVITVICPDLEFEVGEVTIITR